jgi:hypothetical protein
MPDLSSQGIRRISALYTPYNYEMGIDLREQMTLCDSGDVFTIPANLEKTFDQVSYLFFLNSFPCIAVRHFFMTNDALKFIHQ